MSSQLATASSEVPVTPSAKAQSNTVNTPLKTPPNHTSTAAGGSLKRVHFSPQHEEITDSTPQSSPTRARMRPRGRGILKRSLGCADQTISSDIDGNMDQLGEHGLLAQFSSPPSSPNREANAGSTSAFPRGTALNSLSQATVAESAERALVRAITTLHHINSDNSQDKAMVAARAYNELCGLVAKHSQRVAEKPQEVGLLFSCLKRDISDIAMSRPAVLAATKCLGCLLHNEKTSVIAADSKQDIFEALYRRIREQFLKDKLMCQAAVWCVGVFRAPITTIQTVAQLLVQLCTSVLSQFDTSATMQYECLTAIEALLKRAPSVIRQIYRLWLFPVFRCVISPIQGVRGKADDIIRHNIPWIAANSHGKDMDGPVQEFIRTRLDRMLSSLARLLDRNEQVLVSRIWGMLVTICARHCRPRINDILKIIQECFNSEDPKVLVAALMQWRCLIYAFALENRIQAAKCVQLVLTPILKVLERSNVDNDVRRACFQCWATLIYALGEHLAGHTDALVKVVKISAREKDPQVRSIVARVLAAVLCRFMLPAEKVAQFIVLPMIIGTTTLAAADGKSLSNTRGPFSSDVSYIGDHTAILCQYFVGLDNYSPAVPAVVDAAVEFIKAHVYCNSCDQCKMSGTSLSAEPDLATFAGLCKTTAAALCSLHAAESDSKALASALAKDLADFYLQLGQECLQSEQQTCGACSKVYKGSPRSFLFTAVYEDLEGVLVDSYVDASENMEFNALQIAKYSSHSVKILADQHSCSCDTPYSYVLARARIFEVLAILEDKAHVCGQEGCSAAEVETLFPVIAVPISSPDASDSLKADAIFLALVIAEQLLKSKCPIYEAVVPLVSRTLKCICDRMNSLIDSAYISIVAILAVRIHYYLPLRDKMDDTIRQIVRQCSLSIGKSRSWETRFAIVTDMMQVPKHEPSHGTLELVIEFCQGSTVEDSEGSMYYASVLTLVVFAVLSILDIERLPNSIVPASVGQPPENCSSESVTVFLESSAQFLQQVTTLVPDLSPSFDMPFLRWVLKLLSAVPCSDAKSSLDVVKTLTETAEDLLKRLDESNKQPETNAASLPWAFEGTLVGTTPGGHKRMHSASTSEVDPSESIGSAVCSPRQPEASACAAATPPKARSAKRRKRNKSIKRKTDKRDQQQVASSPVATSQTESLCILLDQAEAELESLSACGLGPLIQAQSHVLRLHQRLCEMMQRQADAKSPL
ncbi:Rap1-interacting factor 1 N terminal-domain-containing protein [Coemansia mojavensis]|nr:Rap1-interacting factor 1 N terminal-domain-containing protein [Coemansia mojavensis]